jgi:hypothetical protein
MTHIKGAHGNNGPRARSILNFGKSGRPEQGKKRKKREKAENRGEKKGWLAARRRAGFRAFWKTRKCLMERHI